MKKLLVFALSLAFVVGICAPIIAQPTDPAETGLSAPRSIVSPPAETWGELQIHASCFHAKNTLQNDVPLEGGYGKYKVVLTCVEDGRVLGAYPDEFGHAIFGRPAPLGMAGHAIYKNATYIVQLKQHWQSPLIPGQKAWKLIDEVNLGKLQNSTSVVLYRRD